MSGHLLSKGVYELNQVSDDPVFEEQKLAIKKLNKTVRFTADTLGSENCGTFVSNVLKNNGIDYPTETIYKAFRNTQQQQQQQQ